VSAVTLDEEPEGFLVAVTRQRDGGCVVLHLHVDVRDAMGANAVNTMAEALAPRIVAVLRGDAHADNAPIGAASR